MENNAIRSLLATYPRERPPLGKNLQERYLAIYQASRHGRGILYSLTQRLESWMHRQVAARGGGRILEIGAGTFNHLPYERGYASYDAAEPFTALFEGSSHTAAVRTIYKDIGDIDPGTRYDRIISVAALEHIVNLPECMARAALLLEKDGVFQAGIPSEGGFLWGFLWRVTVGLNFRLRTGCSYKELMQHEHVNDAQEIIALARHMFRSVRITWFPLPHRHLALYGYIEATGPIPENCG